MEADAQSAAQKAEILHALSSGHLSSSVSTLTAFSKAIPTGKDFHFYYNFDEFKIPVKDIISRSNSALERVGGRSVMSGGGYPSGDVDEGLDWVVGVNDETLEKFDVAVDEFEKLRRKAEEAGVWIGAAGGMEEDGFQVVGGRKGRSEEKGGEEMNMSQDGGGGVRVATRDVMRAIGARPRVPFHIPAITKPQEQYKILVNNANQPFEHVWLQRSEDGTRFVHPLVS